MKQLLLLIGSLLMLSSCSAELLDADKPSLEYRSLIQKFEFRDSFQVTLYGADGVSILSTDTAVLTGQPYYLQGRHLFMYRWEHDSAGIFIAQRQPDFDRKIAGGVTVEGTFSPYDTILYDTAKLWLPYPADRGTAGEMVTEDSADIQRVGAADFPITQASGLSRTVGYRCGTETTQIWSFFTPGIGLTGQLVYRDGVRRTSAIRFY